MTAATMAEGNSVSANPLPGMAASGVSSATNATLPVSSIPGQKRTIVLVAGIGAVLVTFQRAFSRRRPVA